MNKKEIQPLPFVKQFSDYFIQRAKRVMIKRLLCFLFRHKPVKTKHECYGHESIEYAITYFTCSRCGEKTQERDDY